jgi:hypothetical protein
MEHLCLVSDEFATHYNRRHTCQGSDAGAPPRIRPGWFNDRIQTMLLRLEMLVHNQKKFSEFCGNVCGGPARSRLEGPRLLTAPSPHANVPAKQMLDKARSDAAKAQAPRWCLSLNFGDLVEQPATRHNCRMDPSLYPAAWMLTLVILTALSSIVTSEE